MFKIFGNSSKKLVLCNWKQISPAGIKLPTMVRNESNRLLPIKKIVKTSPLNLSRNESVISSLTLGHDEKGFFVLKRLWIKNYVLLLINI